ncbi:MAG TPA: O-antigen ligase family protein [Bryobacteraceae bacterium]|jgi:O-antigen ligase|nr:O-antigen ligase family protein [Bryobacteraceae bacterium]
MRWLGFLFLSAGLGAGLVLNGGALPQQWNWSLLAIAVAGICNRFARRHSLRPQAVHARSWRSSDFWITVILFALPLWAALQMIPLPQGLVSFLSPMRAEIARATGSAAWIPLSIGPARTFQFLLNAVGDAVTFLVIRELAVSWRRNVWLLTLPILIFGSAEGLLGLYQFQAGRQSGNVLPSSGTWVNSDHFSGFLEMVLPLALTGAFAAWNSGVLRREPAGGKTLKAAAALMVAAIGLSAIVVSVSRAGFVSAIVSLVAISLIRLFAAGARSPAMVHIPASARIAAGIGVLVAASAAILLLPTDELINRFALATASTQNVSGEIRLELWRDTTKMISAYPLTGSGLGTFESGLMLFKTAAPMNTADYAHNDYLQATAEAGIVAVLAGLIWVALVLTRAVRGVLSWENAPNHYLALGAAGSMIAILVHSLVDFNLYIPANQMVFAWICGIAAGSALQARRVVTTSADVRVIQPVPSQ